MIDADSVNRYIHAWIQNSLSVEHEELGGWAPCPYAHMARWRSVPATGNPDQELLHLAENWDDQYDVVILAYDARWISADSLTSIVDRANYDFLAPCNLIALEDHPDSPESVNGVVFNNGLLAIIMIQRWDRLSRATKMLKRTDYYDRWPQEYYDSVVAYRECLGCRVLNQAQGVDS